MIDEDNPVKAIAEQVNVTPVNIIPITHTGKPYLFKKKYITPDTIELHEAVSAEKYNPTNLKPLFPSHKERTISERLYSYLTKPKNPTNKMIRDELDIDINKVNKVCKSFGLDLEKFGLSELETLILSLEIGNKTISLEKYCKTRKLIHEKRPNLEKEKPYAYLYLFINNADYRPFKNYDELETLLDNEEELDRINNSSIARNIYYYLINENPKTSRRISALDAVEHEENYNLFNHPTRFLISQKKGGRTRGQKNNKQKSKKLNKSRKTCTRIKRIKITKRTKKTKKTKKTNRNKK